MSISIDWGNKIILIPKTYLTYVNGSNYILDTNQFRLTLKELEASENGIVFDETHNHNTEINIGGLTLARTVEIINGYTITFEDGQYAVNLTGANSNIGEVINLNQVSIRSSNSAGMVTVPGSDPNILTILNLMEADELLTPTVIKKYLKGTNTEILSKTVTGGSIQTVEIREDI